MLAHPCSAAEDEEAAAAAAAEAAEAAAAEAAAAGAEVQPEEVGDGPIRYLHGITRVIFCPTCPENAKVPQARVSGCNHLHCAQCNEHLCWCCGAVLVPGERGSYYDHFGGNDEVDKCPMFGLRAWANRGEEVGPDPLADPEAGMEFYLP